MVVVNASVGRTGDDVTLAFRYVGPAVSGTLEGTVALGPTSLLGSFEGTDDLVLDSQCLADGPHASRVRGRTRR